MPGLLDESDPRLPTSFAGGAYDASFESGRAAGTVEVDIGSVVAKTSGGVTVEVPFEGMQIEVGGTNGAMTFCRTPDGQTTVYTNDAKFLRALSLCLHQATADQAQSLLSRRTKKKVGGMAFWWSVAGVLAILACCSPWLLAWAVDRAARALPISVDESLGEAGFEQMSAQLKPIEDKVVVDAMAVILTRLREALPADTPAFRFRVLVVRDDSLNAFALPGGQMVFHSKLLELAESPAEVAGVMAHEMAHVLKRHSVQRIGQALGVTSAVAFVIGDAGPLMSSVAEYLSMAAINKYSREHESEADSVSVELLHRSGLDPTALSTMFERMESGESKLPEGMHWISTHPSHEQRIGAIAAQVESLPKVEARPLEIDWSSVRTALMR